MLTSRHINSVVTSFSLRKVASTGQITQVRNHVKIYPWRFNRNNRECYLDPTKTPYTDRFNINEFNHNKRQKDWQKVIPKDKDNRFNAYKWNESYKSDPKEAKETAESRLRRLRDSLHDRGAARESKPYDPPENVQNQILFIIRSSQLTDGLEKHGINLQEDDMILALDLNQSKSLKLNLIRACIKHFNHDMTSSYLDDMNTVGDVVEFFSTPVRGINPYSSMLRQDDSLPVNLSLIAEPLRYNRESDERFGGHSALPGTVSKVPGLRAAKKYPILNQEEFQWPDI